MCDVLSRDVVVINILLLLLLRLMMIRREYLHGIIWVIGLVTKTRKSIRAAEGPGELPLIPELVD